ncbi:uncharacterized protein EI90DRAFT_3082360 [Cantharellus anzutake]|uniref:uncharacterized protein n=1 Tax=Cantharellus anzutake TaxID=1750568 RepID=UPI00190431D0|nr:uncharacterized protein EI90DRAFT_3082360 [Cantharellus anzutake]KAF8319237.1 hypothetical protein EI90DRAFT_3082360 [Cantharellus anzutake]
MAISAQVLFCLHALRPTATCPQRFYHRPVIYPLYPLFKRKSAKRMELMNYNGWLLFLPHLLGPPFGVHPTTGLSRDEAPSMTSTAQRPLRRDLR